MGEVIKDLVDIFAENKIGKDKIMEYLLGEKQKLLDGRTYRKYYSGEILIPLEKRIAVVRARDWSAKRLETVLSSRNHLRLTTRQMLCNATEKIKELYKKVIADNTDALCVEQMIQGLVFWDLFNTYKVGNLFLNDEITINRTNVVWKEKDEELKRAVKNKKLVFVSGEPASGKSRLVMSFLNSQGKKTDKYINYIWIEPASEITANLKFQSVSCIDKKKIETWEGLLNHLEKIDVDTFVVIKKSVLSQDELRFIGNQNFNSKVRLIIITRNQVARDSNYDVVYTDNWPSKLLKKIADNSLATNKKLILNQEDYEELFEKTGYNPYLVELICKSVCSTCRNESGKITMASIFSRIGTGEAKTIHSDYDKKRNKRDSSNTIKYLLENILRPYRHIQKDMAELFLWTTTAVSKKFLINIADIPEYLIDRALSESLLVWISEKDDLVKMPPILSEAVWHSYSLSIDDEAINHQVYRDFVIKSFNTLTIEKENEKFPYQAVYETWWYMIERIHRKMMTIKSNTGNDEQELRINSWISVLEEIRNISNKLGNTLLEEQINELLYIRYKKKEQYEQSTSEQRFRKKLSERKSAFVKHHDLKQWLDSIVESSNIFFEEVEGEEKSLLYRIYLDEIFAICDFSIQRYNVRMVMLLLADEDFQIQRQGIEWLPKVVEQFNSQLLFYESDRSNYSWLENRNVMDSIKLKISYSRDYYNMIYCYIESVLEERTVQGRTMILQRAQEWLREFDVLDVEWKLKGILQSLLYEHIFMARFHIWSPEWWQKLSLIYQKCEEQIQRNCCSKDILELYYLVGILRYTFFLKNADEKTITSLKEFWSRLITTHTEQFTMSEADKETLKKADEKIRNTVFNIQF